MKATIRPLDLPGTDDNIVAVRSGERIIWFEQDDDYNLIELNEDEVIEQQSHVIDALLDEIAALTAKDNT